MTTLEKAKLIANAHAPRTFQARASGETAEVFIYDDIGATMFGEGITAKQVVEALNASKAAKSLNVYISSGGGSLFEGLAIYNAIRRFPGKKTCYVDSIAASAASVVAMAGDEIVMAHNAEMMIHEAQGMTVGSADDHTETAELLRKVTADTLISTYARTGQTPEQIAAWLKEEKWMNAEEAVALGFADRVLGPEVQAHAPPVVASATPHGRQRPVAPGPAREPQQQQITNATPRRTNTMNDPITSLNEKLAKLHAEAKAIQAAADAAGREMTPEEVQKVDELSAACDQTKVQIQARRRIEEREMELAQPQPRLVQPDPISASLTQAPPPARATITGGTRVDANFANHGFTRGLPEFLNAVKLAAYGKSDPRLLNAVTTYGGEGVGTDGGFAVPPQFASSITSVVQGEDSLVAKFNPILTSGNQVVLPTDETTPWGSSGIYGEWLGEAGSMTDRKPALKQITVTLNKVGALVHLSDELQADAAAIQSHVTRKVAQAIAAKVNEAIVNGDGVAKPLGLNKAPGIVTQAKSGATLAGVDLGSMLSRIPPESVNNCFWLVHSSFLPKVWSLTLGNLPVFVSDWKQSPWGAILGRPVFVSEYCQDYNTAGDVMLVSPDGYVVAVKSMGVETAASIHFAFNQGLNSFRAIMRVGGLPLASGTIARKNGSTTLSHIINLQARS